jgi:hypothetical protein
MKKNAAKKTPTTKKALIKQRLEELARANRGRLTPAIVIADAKNASSPLHKHFTWDIKRAAWKCWVEQARELIRSVRVEVHTQTHVIMAPRYVHSPRSGKGPGYGEAAVMRSSRDVAVEAFQYEIERAVGTLERACEVAGALGLEAERQHLTPLIADLRQMLVTTTKTKKAA